MKIKLKIFIIICVAMMLSFLLEFCTIGIISQTKNNVVSAEERALLTQPATKVSLEDLRQKRIIWSKDYPERSDINHDELLAANDMYIGWLSFHFNPPDDAKNIDLEMPIAFETELDYYLKHDFYKNPDPNGTVFMDFQSIPLLCGYNDFLYAHHASNKTLFGTLNYIYEFDNPAWFMEHPQYMYIYTDTACHKYVLVGYERIDDSNDHFAYTTCETEDMYWDYVDYLKNLPDYIPSKEVDWTTKPSILNFSTCDGESGTTKRFVVHFVKIMAYAK